MTLSDVLDHAWVVTYSNVLINGPEPDELAEWAEKNRLPVYRYQGEENFTEVTDAVLGDGGVLVLYDMGEWATSAAGPAVYGLLGHPFELAQSGPDGEQMARHPRLIVVAVEDHPKIAMPAMFRLKFPLQLTTTET